MKLLDRYILREMVVPFLIGQAAIVLMLTGTVLYNNADVLLIHQVPLAEVVRMVLFFLPFLIHMTMPVAMAVAASLAISRLGRDSEITVMRSSGVSLARVCLPIFIIGLALSVGDFAFGEYVVPASMNRFDFVLAEIPTRIPTLAPEAGKYIVSLDGRYVFFVNTMIPRPGYIELRGVQITAGMKAILAGESQPMEVDAQSGRYQDGTWTLYNPVVYRHSLDGKTFARSWPQWMTLHVAVNPQEFESSLLLQLPMGTLAQAATRTFTELGADLRRERAQGIRDPYAVLDYHFKLSVPFSCLVMALCCAPLAFRFAKGGGFMGTLLSICLVFVYWNTLLLARILGSPGPEGGAPLLSPVVAAWSQNVLFAAVGLWVLRRSE